MIKPRCLTSLSIVFPCYNEETNVAAMIDQAVQTGESYGVDYEVIAVDDGSRDRTAEIAAQKAQKNPRVRLVRHEKNSGYGAAVRTALKSATKDLVFLTDGDNQFRIAEIDKLFSKIDSCDAVVGFRIQRQDQAHRVVNGILWTYLNRLLFGLSIRDVDCAFKLFRRKSIVDLEMRSNHLLINAEILARLRKKGCRIEEIGVTHHPRVSGKSTATSLKSLLKTFRELLKLYWKIKTE